jgi:AbrB family looped-hinge helix DNA binding protein
MVYTSRLSSKGQVTIPSEVRESLSLGAGDLVSYDVHGEEAVLKRIEPFDAAFHATLSATLDEWGSLEDEEAFRDL